MEVALRAAGPPNGSRPDNAGDQYEGGCSGGSGRRGRRGERQCPA